jgi:hypothetical protein
LICENNARGDVMVTLTTLFSDPEYSETLESFIAEISELVVILDPRVFENPEIQFINTFVLPDITGTADICKPLNDQLRTQSQEVAIHQFISPFYYHHIFQKYDVQLPVNLQEMAEFYLKITQKIQLSLDVVIGWSFGGLLADAIYRQSVNYPSPYPYVVALDLVLPHLQLPKHESKATWTLFEIIFNTWKKDAAGKHLNIAKSELSAHLNRGEFENLPFNKQISYACEVLRKLLKEKRVDASGLEVDLIEYYLQQLNVIELQSNLLSSYKVNNTYFVPTQIIYIFSQETYNAYDMASKDICMSESWNQQNVDHFQVPGNRYTMISEKSPIITPVIRAASIEPVHDRNEFKRAAEKKRLDRLGQYQDLIEALMDKNYSTAGKSNIAPTHNIFSADFSTFAKFS